MRVFVYGTLRRGQFNNIYLYDSKYEGTFKVPGFIMRDIGCIPMIEYGDRYIVAERYQINDTILRKLDELEGHPFFYVRKALKVEGDRCYIYVKPPYSKHSGEIIPSGDWLNRGDTDD